MQRRLRERRRVREEMLLDLGALVYELHRQGKRAPELLQDKAAALSVIDDEVRAMEEALGGAGPEETAPEQATEALDAAEPDLLAGLEDDEELDQEEADEPDQPDDEPVDDPQPTLAEREEPNA